MDRRTVVARIAGVSLLGLLSGCTAGATLGGDGGSATERRNDTDEPTGAGGAKPPTTRAPNTRYGLSTCRSFEGELAVEILTYDPESGLGRLRNVFDEDLYVSILLEGGRYAEGPDSQWPAFRVGQGETSMFDGGGTIREVSAVDVAYYRQTGGDVDWKAIHDRSTNVGCLLTTA